MPDEGLLGTSELQPAARATTAAAANAASARHPSTTNTLPTTTTYPLISTVTRMSSDIHHIYTITPYRLQSLNALTLKSEWADQGNFHSFGLYG
jgi:hypothetical protein